MDRERGGRAPSSTDRRIRMAVVVNVNDNAGARYLTSLMLRKAGYEVLEATNGVEALAFADQLPDVMVLDVQLPDIDGLEVCRRIRANPKTARIKILHTSATFVSLEKKVEGLKGGADGYLAQPFEAQELLATIQSLVRLSSAEHDLESRANDLVESSRRKDDFLAMLAHELRNPLSAISAAVPLLCEHDARSEKEARAREIVDRQIRHLAKLIDDLLDVARVTRGKIEFHKATFDLTDLVRRVAAVIQETKIGPRGQVLSLEVPDRAIFVDGDAMRLEQVFANLFDNASKYTDAGGSIRVVMRRLPGDDRRVRIQVKDDGIGIASETLPSIFDLFSQATVAIDRSRGGLGIGLTLVKTLVEMHDGQIRARSEGIGRGAEFEVELPVSIEAAASPPEDEATHRSAAPAPPRRILLVEDNADARDGLADLWETWGHQVSLAEDGVEAVRRALEEKPDVAFVDIGLPKLDGYEVARHLRADPAGKDLLLIALTGYGAPEQRARALDAGFDHHLVKPVDPKRVQRLLGDLPGARASSRRVVRR